MLKMGLGNSLDRPHPVGARDDLEHALLQAHTLIESAVSRHCTGEDRELVTEISSDHRSVMAATDQIARLARRELVATVPTAASFATGPRTIGDTLPELAGQGVQIRMVCSPETLQTTRDKWITESSRRHVPVRVTKCSLQELVIADGRSALIRTGGGSAGQQAVVLRDPAVVNSLYTLFNGVWELSSPIGNEIQLDDSDELERNVLARLRDGYIDDVAARELGISVRTYRRYVAKIMQDVGATSRFQAGVLVNRLGLRGTRGQRRQEH